MIKSFLFILLPGILFFFSCAKTLPTYCENKVYKKDTTINTGHDNGQDTIEVQYLGCGGLLLAKDDTKILVDPFFTNPKPFGSLLTKKINPDANTIIKAFDSIDEQKVQQMLITHAHYDHLMDVPFIIKKYYKGSLPVMASNTANNMLLKEGIDPQNLTTVDACAARGKTMGKWFYITKDSSCRIMPVIYAHAPHFKLWFIPVKLYKGYYDKEPKKLKRASHWKEGQTLGYLVDFMLKGKVQIRVYLLAAGAANPGIGFIDSIPGLRDKKIDLMVLCVASHEYVKEYPGSIINAHTPGYILGAHWEDFFTGYFAKGNKKGVRLTNVPEFYKKMDGLKYSEKWNLANPLVKMKFVF